MSDFILHTSTKNGSGNVTHELLLMSPSSYIAAALVLSLIGFFGFFLNLLVILLMWNDKQLWTPVNIILFNLVCSDFSISILGNPWTLVSAIHYGWIWGRTMCVMYGFFMSLLGITSITSYTVLAFVRFQIVTKPFYNKYLRQENSIFIVAGIWVYSGFLTAPPLFGWGKYDREAANISCSVNWEDKRTETTSYILYLFFFGLVVPLVIIIYSYGQIWATMKKNKLNIGRVSRVEAKTTYMILLMIVAFLTAWAPYSVFALLAQFGDDSLITPATGVLPALIAKSSICYNPIIYIGLNNQFRKSFKQVFSKKSNSRGEDMSVTYALAVSRVVSQPNSPGSTQGHGQKSDFKVTMMGNNEEIYSEDCV